jgi:microcystin-dependent protein
MEEFIGTIKLFAGNYAPRDYAFCNGQLLQIAQNNALFSIIGTTYGGDGRTTFALPDLRSRVPVGAGQGHGLTSYAAGQQVGIEKNMLNATNLPVLKGTVDLTNLNGNATGTVSTTTNASIPVPCSTSADSNNPRSRANPFAWF